MLHLAQWQLREKQSSNIVDLGFFQSFTHEKPQNFEMIENQITVSVILTESKICNTLVSKPFSDRND